MEWPTDCADRGRQTFLKLIADVLLQEVCMDGCALGVQTRAGFLLKKPWRLCTNVSNILPEFRKYKCPNSGSLTDHIHGQCRGDNCKQSETFVWETVRVAHKAFVKQQANLNAIG